MRDLADERVRLRPWQAGDAGSIEAIARDPFVARWSSMGDDVAGWLARQRARAPGLSLAITRPGDERPLGKVALRLDAPRVAELSYWLLPPARGQGLALAAARLHTRWAFAALRLERVMLEVEDDNRPSLRLAASLGAVRVGRRTETDRQGVRRTLIAHQLVPSPGSIASWAGG